MAIAAYIKTIMEQSSWIRRMFETGNELKAKYGPENVYDFSLGNPDIPPPDSFNTLLRDISERHIGGKHGYMSNAGYPEVRRKIAAYLSAEQKAEFREEHVVMTAGAGAAMNIALKTLLNAGDEVIVSTPCFMEYAFYTMNHGGTLKFVPALADFDLDVPAIEKAVNSKTAAVIINSPNNPSGRVYPLETLRRLAESLEKSSSRTGRTIYLLSDEPYRKIVYPGVSVPAPCSLYPHTLLASSYSKDLSIPGERIGYLAVNPECSDTSSVINGAVLCNRILGFVNAPALMQRIVGEIPGESIDVSIYTKRMQMFYSALTEIGYDVRKPDGTFYLFPKALKGDDLMTVDLLREENILTVPGRGFGTPGYFRIAFCVGEKTIEGSLPGFERVFRKAGSTV